MNPSQANIIFNSSSMYLGFFTLSAPFIIYHSEIVIVQSSMLFVISNTPTILLQFLQKKAFDTLVFPNKIFVFFDHSKFKIQTFMQGLT